MDVIEGIGRYAPDTARDADAWDRLAAFVKSEPQAFDRNPETGHVTGSAFVLSPDMQSVLLTHHAKLDLWLQLGGHCDGLRDAVAVAEKEACEESGLARLHLVSDAVFDVDIHEIPANAREAAHLHYDVRFLFRAESTDFTVSDESHALAWVPLARLHDYSRSRSVLVVRDRLARFLP
ncbi:NUDIX hydrolase [Shimia sp. SDUM112013]|uniref:NUDIX hydrolase n=1 Tax=Shimia sp. SDUM112013 TaxID=3136160 RepID=UPI0032EE4252